MNTVQAVTIASPLVKYSYEKAVAKYNLERAETAKLLKLASEVARLSA